MNETSPSVSAYTPPTPPPASSTASLPPSHLGHGGASDLRRHQSLNQGYGRAQRERLERTNALLSMDHRDDQRQQSRSTDGKQEPPPTSPIGPSMWSIQAGENGWTNLNGLSETFDGLQLNRRIAEHNANTGIGGGNDVDYTSQHLNQMHLHLQNQSQSQGQGQGRRMTDQIQLLPPLPQTAGPMGEPSWVTNLVGHDIPPQVRSAHSASWQDRDALLRQHQQGMLPPHQQQQQQRWDQGHVPLAYLQQQQQQHQQQQMQGVHGGYGMGMGMKNQYSAPGYPQHGGGGYMGAPVYSTPPPSAHALGPQDQAVIELARAKGLNPATYNCRPQAVSLDTVAA